MKRFILAIGLLSISSFISAKVLIITHSYNRPDFIEIQAKTFDALLEDDYEFVVFNDASSDQMKNQIEQACQKLALRCIRVPQHLHASDGSAGARHVHGMQYAFDTLAYDHDGIVLLFDSDMFLIKPFCVEKYLEDYEIAGQLQSRGGGDRAVQYLSPAIAFMNMQILPNKRTLSFAGGRINGFGCDNGAQTYYYFKNNPTVQRRLINVVHGSAFAYYQQCHTCSNLTCSSCVSELINNGFDQNIISFMHECPNLNVEFFLDYHFLHYRGGSNWDGQAALYHKIKTQALNNLVNKVIAENI